MHPFVRFQKKEVKDEKNLVSEPQEYSKKKQSVSDQLQNRYRALARARRKPSVTPRCTAPRYPAASMPVMVVAAMPPGVAASSRSDLSECFPSRHALILSARA